MTLPPGFTPPWPCCDGAVGCVGRRVDPHSLCLAHLSAGDRAVHLSRLGPGADVDYCGTTFDTSLLNALLNAVRDPVSGSPQFGDADFRLAVFDCEAVFGGARFSGAARFGGARFADAARFGDATFIGDASFGGATFAGTVGFLETVFVGDAWFGGAVFADASRLGPLVCGGRMGLTGAVFKVPVSVEVAAARVSCARTSWEATATLRLRHAELDLTDAVITQPLAVNAYPAPFPGTEAFEAAHLTGAPGVRVTSLRGVDAAYVVLTDLDLTGCRFVGAFHLDQLSLTGHTIFAEPPAGWRWTRRRVLAEEHAWRALTQPPTNPSAPTVREWTPGPGHPDPAVTPGPEDIAPVYRALRKGFEDAKNEPDAADFYYGEMEIRRHDHERPRGERFLLTLYWALSGYGLRASRALAWLALAVVGTVFALMLWGLPNADPEAQITGKQPLAGQDVRLTVDAPSPTLTRAYADRFTWKRAEKASRVVVNSVVFRSSGQNLTTSGTYIEMLSRFTEPVLLAFAALAVRGRVKR